MDVAVIGVLIPIIATISIVVMIIYLRRFENDERMAMIEKGVDPALFNLKKNRSTSLPLRFSLLMIGVGLGLFIGYFLDRLLGMYNPIAYISMLFIFGGIGLGLAYIIEEKKMKEDKEE